MPLSYRLLRDNKERGPFSLEDLLSLSLKPYDLIWVEGQSAGWRYPAEIPSLQAYLEQPASERENNSYTPQNHPASQPSRAVVAEQTISAVSQPEEVEEVITAEQLEKKAAEIYLRVQTYTQQKEQGKDVEIKHTRSLEDLKQEYADWLHHKKTKKKTHLPGKEMLIALAVIFAGLAIYFILSQSRSANDLSLEEPASYVSNAEHTSKAVSENQAAIRQPINTKFNNTNGTTSSSVDAFLDSVRKVVAKQDAALAGYSIHYPKSKKKTPLVPIAPTEKKQESVTAEDLTALVNMDAKYIQDRNALEVTIKNNSTQLLKKIAVDVFYYRNGDRLFDKQTLYIHNVEPGNSFTLSAPGNKKAASARFELKQIN